MTYNMGDVHFPMLTMRANDKDAGEIRVGGDHGDIHAASAEPYFDGVLLCDVTLTTSQKRMCVAGQTILAQDIVYSAWESIQEDAFAPSRR